ncbi:MAG: helix-turn-helix domain-containing protein [Acidovorax sp.]|nr:helix-turn-helix domain-containing protein [Acidovorax sp.]
MTTSIPCIPLSKEDVAKAMGVTTRTIENWVKYEGMPAPSSIGNRVYWHPDIFDEWLQRRLRGQDACVDAVPVASRKRKSSHSSDHDQIQLRNAKRIADISGVSNG